MYIKNLFSSSFCSCLSCFPRRAHSSLVPLVAEGRANEVSVVNRERPAGGPAPRWGREEEGRRHESDDTSHRRGAASRVLLPSPYGYGLRPRGSVSFGRSPCPPPASPLRVSDRVVSLRAPPLPSPLRGSAPCGANGVRETRKARREWRDVAPCVGHSLRPFPPHPKGPHHPFHLSFTHSRRRGPWGVFLSYFLSCLSYRRLTCLRLWT